MGFNQLRERVEEGERRAVEAETNREADFSRRVAIQQMLNNTAPIFKACAAGAMAPEHLIEGPGLRDYAEAARRMAVMVASKLAGVMPSDADPAMVRMLMPSMGELVARMIRGGIPLDAPAAAESVARTLELADPKFDFNPFERNPVSPEASLKMTAAAGAAAVVAQLAWYDFRSAAPVATAARVLEAVVVKAAAAVMRIAGSMGERDRTSLMQSFVKHYSEIMADALANRAAATLAALKGLDAAGRDAWYRDNDPVAEAVARFEALAGGLAGAQLVWEQAMKDPAALLASQPSAPGAA
jgi:hypothetical protein